MDDIQLIHRLASALQTAAEAQDWGQVQKVDSHIAQMLQALQGRSGSDEKRAALEQLERLHRDVYRLCVQQSRELEIKMTEHRQKREALSAYATFTLDEVK